MLNNFTGIVSDEGSNLVRLFSQYDNDDIIYSIQNEPTNQTSTANNDSGLIEPISEDIVSSFEMIDQDVIGDRAYLNTLVFLHEKDVDWSVLEDEIEAYNSDDEYDIERGKLNSTSLCTYFK